MAVCYWMPCRRLSVSCISSWENIKTLQKIPASHRDTGIFSYLTGYSIRVYAKRRFSLNAGIL